MAYQKRRSAILEKAQTRLRGLQSLSLAMDLGNGLTLQSYTNLIESSITQLEAHNLALSEADRTRIEFAETEATVSQLSSRILSAVAAIYGKDSKEYEMAGGKPLSTYKRSKKQTSATATSLTQMTGSQTAIASNGSVTNGSGATISSL